MAECPRWNELSALYGEEGEAAPLIRHLETCALCLERARTEAPEVHAAALLIIARPHLSKTAKEKYLNVISMPWEAVPKRSLWLDGLRRAAAVALAAGLGWSGYVLYQKTSETALPDRFQETISAESADLARLRERYPLVREAAPSALYYTATLGDGTRMVYFHVPNM